MAEFFDDDCLFGDAHKNAKHVEVIPEMLDYEFIGKCTSVDELRSVLAALKKGEYGRYPDLERATRTKLIDLLPKEDKEKINDIDAKQLSDIDVDVDAQKESLIDWIGNMAGESSPRDVDSTQIHNAAVDIAPVRAITQVDLDSKSTPKVEDNSAKPNDSAVKPEIFRKEKLSTKEYFDRWDKFDVDAATFLSESSDEEEEIEHKHEMKVEEVVEEASQKLKDELAESCNKFHSMVIEEVNEDSNAPDEEEYDYIEEIYTPGAEALESQMLEEEQRCTQSNISSRAKAAPDVSQSLKADISNSMNISSANTDTSTMQAWHKISIVETSDSDEEDGADIEGSAKSMRRITIQEETDDEEEAKDEVSPAQAADSEKLKLEGNAAMSRGEYENALQFYTLAMEMDPDNVKALNNRSIANTKLEKWDKAIEDANSCVDTEPNNTKAIYRRGHALMMRGHTAENIEQALVDFELALSLDPPKEQVGVLRKKLNECQKILSSMEDVQVINSKSSGKKKVRSHDTQALAF